MKTQERTHPLNGLTLACPYNNWHQWRKQWDDEPTPDQCMSLLHTGFSRETGKCEHDEPSYSWLDIVVFYLSIADGWRFGTMFAVDGSGSPRRYPMTRENGDSTYVSKSEVSQALARKAFAVLATKFFAPEGAVTLENALKEWSLTVFSHRLLSELVYFFRVDETHSDFRMHNVPEGTSEAMANHANHTKGFLIKLLQVLWSYKEHLERWGKLHPITDDGVLALVENVEAIKPWSIKVMHFLKRYDIIGDAPLSDGCVSALKEIAMRNSIRDRKGDRPVKTVYEAFSVGCPAATILQRRSALQEVLNPPCKKRKRRRKARTGS